MRGPFLPGLVLPFARCKCARRRAIRASQLAIAVPRPLEHPVALPKLHPCDTQDNGTAIGDCSREVIPSMCGLLVMSEVAEVRDHTHENRKATTFGTHPMVVTPPQRRT